MLMNFMQDPLAMYTNSFAGTGEGCFYSPESDPLEMYIVPNERQVDVSGDYLLELMNDKNREICKLCSKTLDIIAVSIFVCICGVSMENLRSTQHTSRYFRQHIQYCTIHAYFIGVCVYIKSYCKILTSSTIWY